MNDRPLLSIVPLDEVWLPRPVAENIRVMAHLYRIAAAQAGPWTQLQSQTWWACWQGPPERWRNKVPPPPRDDEDTTAAQLRRRAAFLEREFLQPIR